MRAKWSIVVRLVALTLAAASLVGCGAPHVQLRTAAPTKPAVQPSPQACKQAVQRAADRQQWSEVDALARSYRGVDEPWMLGWQATALWRLDRRDEARHIEQLLLRVEGTDGSAGEAVLRLARLHLKLRRSPADAWQVLAPLRREGCRDAMACQLHLTALATIELRGAEAVKAALAAAPAPALGAAARTRWLTAVAETWTKATRHSDARELMLRHAAGSQGDRDAWLAAYAVARQQPGSEGRAAWLTAVLQAPLSAKQRTAMATHPELAADRGACRELLVAASKQSDADEAVWQALAAVWMRSDLGAEVASLPLERLASAYGRQVLARAALATRQTALAEAALQGLSDDDAVTLALRGELARRQGDAATARARWSAIRDATGDRSLGELVTAWLVKGPDGEAALERAASTAGRGQRTAARLRAQRLLTPVPTAASSQAVLRYARLLATATPDEGPGPLADEPEPAAIQARQQLLRMLVGPPWAETVATILRLWADAGVADAQQLRQLAQRHLATGDAAGFAATEQEVARVAEREGLPLAPEPLLQELLRRGGPPLARWLAGRPPETVEDGALLWRTSAALLRQEYGLLGLRWLAAARTWAGEAELTAPQLLELAQSGGAQAALDALTRLRAMGKAQDMTWLHVEATALLALQRVDDAEAVLTRAATAADTSGRALRPLLDLAGEYGLCQAIAVLAPKVAAETDLYHLRAALQRGLECARRGRDERLASAMVQAVHGNRLDMTRMEALGQQLSASGWDRLAVQTFAAIQWLRAPSDDTVAVWARSLLLLGQSDGAVAVLDKATASRGRVSRTWLRCAELLEDFGLLSKALPYYRGAIAADPDSSRLRVRLVTALLRLGQGQAAGGEMLALAKLGATEEDLHIVLQAAQRTQGQRALLDGLAGLVDADREVDRFRAELAASLGDRATVVAAVRRMRDRGGLAGARAVGWLQQVGAIDEARQAAEDALASPEPAGQGEDRHDLLQTALALRLDKTSANEALGLVRLYTARALDPEQAATEAAQALTRYGHGQAAWAVAKAWKIDKDLRYTTLRARFAWDGGDRAEARRLWGRVRAASLLDPSVREVLRSTRLANAREARGDDLYTAVSWTWSELVERGLFDETLPWLQDLLQLAPDSEVSHSRIVQTWLHMGRPLQAAAALREARQQLRSWPAELHSLADQIAREGGRALLQPTGDLQTLATERSDPWWLATIAPEQPTAPLVEMAEELCASSPPVRVQWSLRAAARGRGDEAVRWLGTEPTATRDDRLEATLRAMAAALVAVHGQSGPVAAQAQLKQWLQSQRGIDVAVGLGWELLRQGQVELARSTLEHRGVHLGPLSADLATRRLLTACGAADDATLVEIALAYLRGQRSNLVSQPGQPLRAPSDDVFDWMLGAGRITAARQLATLLRADEPALATPPVLADPSAATLSQRIRSADPTVVALLPAAAGQLADTDAVEALALAAAHSPSSVEALASALQAAREEGWRWQLAAARLLVDLGHTDAARAALQRATVAPASVTACLRGALLGADTLAACVAQRPIEALELGELGDLAMMLTRDLPTADRAVAGPGFAEADNAARHRWIAVAAARLQTPALRQAFAQWLRPQLLALPPAEQRRLGLLAMDDLAVFGLGQIGVDVCQAALDHDPHGNGHHNNLAYALHLAGRPVSEVLAHAAWVDRASHGEAAFAALDTLAAASASQGKVAAALDIQRRALAATLAPTGDDAWTASLLLERYASLLIANGQHDEARLVTAEAMRRLAWRRQMVDHPAASVTLLRVLQAALAGRVATAPPAAATVPPAAAPHKP